MVRYPVEPPEPRPRARRVRTDPDSSPTLSRRTSFTEESQGAARATSLDTSPGSRGQWAGFPSESVRTGRFPAPRFLGEYDRALECADTLLVIRPPPQFFHCHLHRTIQGIVSQKTIEDAREGTSRQITRWDQSGGGYGQASQTRRRLLERRPPLRPGGRRPLLAGDVPPQPLPTSALSVQTSSSWRASSCERASPRTARDRTRLVPDHSTSPTVQQWLARLAPRICSLPAILNRYLHCKGLTRRFGWSTRVCAHVHSGAQERSLPSTRSALTHGKTRAE